MNNPAAIKAVDLYKNFKEIQAVRGLNFYIRKGEIFSLLGPNGAGKSTTISMLCGLLKPNSGEAFINGFSILQEPHSARSTLGVVPQDIALYPDLSARENLIFWGKMYGLRGKDLRERVNEVLDLIQLNGRQNSRVSTFSGGMKRRVNIGVALLHKPDLVIMDEPTVGIDPQSRRHILDSVKELNRQGMTILYTTHYMEEAQELSDRIAIMDHGQIIASGTHEELLLLVGERSRIDLTTIGVDPGLVVKAWQEIPGVSKTSQQENIIRVLVEDSNAVLPGLFESARQINARITSVDIQEPDLEAVFLHMTGRALRD